VADLVDAQGRRADERGDVHRNPEPHQVIEPLPKGGPRDLVLDVRLPFDLVAAHRIGERAHRVSFAEDLERHALSHVALRAAVRDQRWDRPREHVDEAGRDREAGDVNLALPAIADRGHDRGDQIGIDRDVRGVRWAALAVIYGPPADDDVVHRAAILRG